MTGGQRLDYLQKQAERLQRECDSLCAQRDAAVDRLEVVLHQLRVNKGQLRPEQLAAAENALSFLQGLQLQAGGRKS